MIKYCAFIMLALNFNLLSFAANSDDILKLRLWPNDKIKDLIHNFEQYEQELLTNLITAIRMKASDMGVKYDDARQLASLYLTYSQLVVLSIHTGVKEITKEYCDTVVYPPSTNTHRDYAQRPQRIEYIPKHSYSLLQMQKGFCDASRKLARSCELIWPHAGKNGFDFAVREVVQDLLQQLNLEKSKTKIQKLYRYAYRIGVLYSLAYKADPKYLNNHFKPSLEGVYEQLEPHYIGQYPELVLQSIEACHHGNNLYFKVLKDLLGGNSQCKRPERDIDEIINEREPDIIDDCDHSQQQ